LSRHIEDLKDWFQPKVLKFQDRCSSSDISILITRTSTDDFTQEALWTIGRGVLTIEQVNRLKLEGLYPDDLTKIKTNAQHASDTPHGLGLAFDCVPLDKSGHPWWSAPDTIWQTLYAIAEKCGLDALGDPWGEFVSWDKGHFQEPGWRVYRVDIS